MNKTIEQRANDIYSCDPCSMGQALKEIPKLDCSYCNRLERIDDYIKGATDQHNIDLKSFEELLTEMQGEYITLELINNLIKELADDSTTK